MTTTTATTARRGKPWSAKEEASLMRRVLEHGADCSLDDLATKHERTTVAVLLRIRKIVQTLQQDRADMSVDAQMHLLRQQFPRAHMALVEQALRTADRSSRADASATTTDRLRPCDCDCSTRLRDMERRLRAVEDVLSRRR